MANPQQRSKGGDPVAAVTTATKVSPEEPKSESPTLLTHCPYHRTTDLLQRLAPGKMRIGFFLGAGCPLSVRVPTENGDSRPLIPEIAGLTDAVRQSLDANKELRDSSQIAWNRVVGRGIADPTVEDVLSHIRTLRSLCGKTEIDGFSHDQLAGLDRAICDDIRSKVSMQLPSADTPYHVLASWIQAIPRDKPVEIFTTNYDLLVEQALEEQRVPYFDGFVGSDSAFLDLESMAEDDLPSRWARLWKIHGSVNWWMTASKKFRRSRDRMDGEQLLIYPSHLKYDQSRQMPYYAMLDRLRVFLRSGQCLLLTCGYSFGDEHINAFIGQGLAGNANAACFGMLYKDRSQAPKAVELAKRHANLSVLAADGAVVGTVERDWTTITKDDNPAYSVTVAQEMPQWRSSAPAERCKWLLGDFASLGQFLGHQLSTRNIERGAQYAD